MTPPVRQPLIQRIITRATGEPRTAPRAHALSANRAVAWSALAGGLAVAAFILFVAWRAHAVPWFVPFAALILAFVFAGYTPAWSSWSGFGTRPLPETGGQKGEVAPSKTLWDWLGLLIVPGVLALGAV